jgi:hypothetical protein
MKSLERWLKGLMHEMLKFRRDSQKKPQSFNSRAFFIVVDYFRTFNSLEYLHVLQLATATGGTSSYNDFKTS